MQSGVAVLESDVKTDRVFFDRDSTFYVIHI